MDISTGITREYYAIKDYYKTSFKQEAFYMQESDGIEHIFFG